MRKRAQYRNARGRLQVKVPTLVIMVAALFCILYFGNTISDRIAEIFEPNSPVTDDVPLDAKDGVPNVAEDGTATDSVAMMPSAGLMKAGTIVAQAHKGAARHILQILSRGGGAMPAARASSRPEGAGGTP